MPIHDGFWIFGMSGVFVGSMDFLHRPVSYTPARKKVLLLERYRAIKLRYGM